MSYLQMVKEWRKKKDCIQSGEADPYKALFDKEIAKLNMDYPTDVLNFIKKHHKQLHEAINESEKRFDRLWGEAPIDEFREELLKFCNLNRKAVKLYREEEI